MKHPNPIELWTAKYNVRVAEPYLTLWKAMIAAHSSTTPTELTGTLPLTFRSNGSVLLDYRIYGNTVETTVKTANLVPLTTQKTATGSGITVTIDDSGVWHVTGTASQDVNILFDLEEAFTVPTALDNGGEGVIQFFNSVAMDDGSGYETARVLFYYGNFQRDYMGLHIQNRSITQYSDLANMAINRLGIWVKQGITCDFTLSPMVVDDGIVHNEYIPPETTEVQGVGVRVDITGLSEPLCGIDTYTDSLNLSTGILTRRIKKLVLTGEELVRRYGKVLSTAFEIVTQDTDLPIISSDISYPAISDRYLITYRANFYNKQPPIPDKGYIGFGGSARTIYMYDPRFTQTEDLKSYFADQYAAGTPVTVWYVLAEPDVSTIPIPSGLAGAVEGYLIQDDTPTPETPIYPTANGVKQGDGTYSIKYGYKMPMVSRTENLFDKDNVLKKYYLNNGVPTQFYSGGYVLSDYIPISSSTATISAKVTIHSPSGSHWAVYDESKTFIRGGTSFVATSGRLTKVVNTSDAAFIRVDFATDSFTDCMLNLGSTAPDQYIPYHRTETPIYIGSDPLSEGEYISYSEQKVYRMVNGVLTPTDPPVPLPELPIFSDADTVLDYEETPAPEEVWVKYSPGRSD